MSTLEISVVSLLFVVLTVGLGVPVWLFKLDKSRKPVRKSSSSHRDALVRTPGAQLNVPDCFTLSTRTLTVLPPADVYRCPITRHSETSSATMSLGRSCIGNTRNAGGFEVLT